MARRVLPAPALPHTRVGRPGKPAAGYLIEPLNSGRSFGQAAVRCAFLRVVLLFRVIAGIVVHAYLRRLTRDPLRAIAADQTNREESPSRRLQIHPHRSLRGSVRFSRNA